MITDVAAPDVVLELRQPPVAVTAYGLSIVVCLGLLVLVPSSGGGALFTVAFLAMAVGICAYNTATVLSTVRAHRDGRLEVRNRLSPHRLRRSDVERVLQGRQGGFGSLHRLELLLADGTTLPLVATETPPLPPLRRRLQRQAEQLRHWLEGGP